MNENRLTRREFLGVAILGAGGALVSGCLPDQALPTPSAKENSVQTDSKEVSHQDKLRDAMVVFITTDFSEFGTARELLLELTREEGTFSLSNSPYLEEGRNFMPAVEAVYNPKEKKLKPSIRIQFSQGFLARRDVTSEVLATMIYVEILRYRIYRDKGIFTDPESAASKIKELEEESYADSLQSALITVYRKFRREKKNSGSKPLF